MVNNWYVLTGGPSSGKTTLLKELHQRGYKTVPESARYVIEQQQKQGKSLEAIRQDETAFQLEVFKQKLRAYKSLDQAALIFFDRGYHDTLAYLQFIGADIPEAVFEACKRMKYKKVFILDMLPYVSDSARTETNIEAHKLHAMLGAAYKQFGYNVTRVPVLPIHERADWIESNL